MDYKKIIKNQNIRFKILKFLNFIPDKTMVKLQYRIKTGRKLNLKNPQRYTEKLQWYKLNYRNPLMTKCADKYTVREYIESKGLGHILNELYGVYDDVNEIDFDKLPNKFVLKTTNDSHTNIFVEDKSQADIEKIKEELNSFMNSRNGKSPGREWAYDNSKRRIICEKYLEKDKNKEFFDYKFFCFNGKSYYMNLVTDSRQKLSIYDMEGNKTKYRRSDIEPITQDIKMPNNFDEMKKIAEKLSEDFPHVRVDLYDINGKIVFGELTFYGSSGYMQFEPDEFDFILGKKLKLEKYQEEK